MQRFLHTDRKGDFSKLNMFSFNAKPGFSFYRTIVLILICLTISSQPQQYEDLKNSLNNCNSTKITGGNLTNQTNGNCSARNFTTNITNEIDIPEAFDFYTIDIVSMTITSFGVLCNLLLILVITINPLKILHRGAWITILNLAIADFIACGDYFVQLYLHQRGHIDALSLIIREVSFFWIFGVGASFMLLTLLTVQIYMIIKYPMKSRLKLTGEKVLMSCTIVWVLAIGLGLCDISYIWTEWYTYFQVGYTAVMEVAVAIQIVLKILIAVEIMRNQHSILNAQNAKQREVAKTVIILNGILIVTALPYFLAKQIEFIARLDPNDYSLPTNFAYYYEPIALLNFVLNPVFYSLRLQDYRRSLVALFKFNCRNRRRTNSISQQRVNKRYMTYLEKTEMTKVNGNA